MIRYWQHNVICLSVCLSVCLSATLCIVVLGGLCAGLEVVLTS